MFTRFERKKRQRRKSKVSNIILINWHLSVHHDDECNQSKNKWSRSTSILKEAPSAVCTSCFFFAACHPKPAINE